MKQSVGAFALYAKRALALVACVLVVAACVLPIREPAYAAVSLKQGSRGADVTKVQKKLIQFKYLTGKADGVYGAQTRKAIEKFQRNNKLTVDGRVGQKTAAKLGVTLTGSSSSATSASRGSSTSDLSLLSRVVHAEARGESYKGKVAVAAVVLNRVKHSSFPSTLSGVVYQSGAFTCVNDGQINLTPDSESIRAARDAMNGWDPTGGCIYYYNPRTAKDKWIHSRSVKTVIGKHRFAT